MKLTFEPCDSWKKKRKNCTFIFQKTIKKLDLLNGFCLQILSLDVIWCYQKIESNKWCSWSILIWVVKVSVTGRNKHSNLTYIEGHNQSSRSIWNYAIVTLTSYLGPDLMLNRYELSSSINHRKVTTHASCETGRTWWRFDHEQRCSSYHTNYDLSVTTQSL